LLGLFASNGCGSGSGTLTPNEVFKKAQPATLQLLGREGDGLTGGTGVVFDQDKGLLLTNQHVVAGVTSLKARTDDNHEVAARVLGVAPCEDVAVVKLSSKPPGVGEVPIGNSDDLQDGDQVTALGYPGSFQNFTTSKVTLTNGTVQAAGVQASPGPSLPTFPDTIQHSATINHGNSGGPLLNDHGELVGINTLTNPGDQSQPVQGQYYALAINHLMQLEPELEKGKNIDDAGWDLSAFSEVPLELLYPNLGIGTAEQGRQDDQLLANNDLHDGMWVWGVDPGSPAERAHFGFGDLITHINGTRVTRMSDVCDALQTASPGETLRLNGRFILSGGQDVKFADPWTQDLRLSR
jgi:S1-C subfamily serine protease